MRCYICPLVYLVVNHSHFNDNFFLVLFKQSYCATVCVWHNEYFCRIKKKLITLTQPSLCGTQPHPLDTLHIRETHTALIYNEEVSRDCAATSDP